MSEDGQEKTPRISIFKRWQMAISSCKGYSKAKWSQMIHTGTEPQNTKNIYIQKLPLKSLELFCAENCSKTHLKLQK